MNKSIWLILGIFIGILLTVVAYYLYPKYLNYSFNKANVSIESKIKAKIFMHYPDFIDSDKQTIKEQLDIEQPSNDINLSDVKPLFIWRTDGNYYISVPGTENTIDINFRHLKLADTINGNSTEPYDLDSDNSKYLKSRFFKLVFDIDEIMLKTGYEKSDENLVRNYGYNSIEVGYEKDKTKCILGSYYGELTFRCNDKIDQYEGRQVDVLVTLKLNDSSVVSIEREIPEKFIKANISEFGGNGGYFSILRYEKKPMANNNWYEIYSGQDNPKCSLMKKYEVPIPIYESCVK